jgi:Tol biopolymer transport system component
LIAFAVGWWVGVRSPQPDSTSVPVSFTQITDRPGVEEYPALAPDGRSFVFVASTQGNNDIYLQRLGGRHPVNLTENSYDDDDHPAFSPNGKQIAFRSGRDGGGVFIMGSSGSPVRRLSDFGYDPCWSPDGSEIVVSSAASADPAVRQGVAELWAIRVADGEKRQVTRHDAMQPSWSPHGWRIAFWGLREEAAGQRDLWTVAADGSEAEIEAVAVTNDFALDWNPVWSPNGDYLYYSSDRGGAMNLWRIPIEEKTGRVLGSAEPVTTPSRWSGHFSLSGDGRRLAYASLDRRSRLLKIAFDSARGSTVGTALAILEGTRLIRDQSISPDGEWIAFATWGGREDLFVVRSDGAGYRQLTDDAFRDRGVTWSPDSEWITFYSDRAGRYETWAIHPDGSGLEQLSRTRGPSRWYPVWSPDATRIATTDSIRAWILDLTLPLDNRRAEPLPQSADARAFMPVSWSPDGNSLAGMYFNPDATVDTSSIVRYAFDSGTYERLLDGGAWPVWLSDSQRFLFVGLQGELLLFDIRSRASHAVLPPGNIASLEGRRLSITDDDRWISFIDTTTEGDIWLLSFE